MRPEDWRVRVRVPALLTLPRCCLEALLALVLVYETAWVAVGPPRLPLAPVGFGFHAR